VDQDVLAELRDRIRAFAAARDWDQFHTPRNLALALGGELGELFELMQWRSDAELRLPLDHALRERLEEELADLMIYLVRLADVLEVDLQSASIRKIETNEERYPAPAVSGRAIKYTEIKRDE